MTNAIQRLLTAAQAEHGQALVEYALILLLVASVVVLSLTAIGTSVNGILVDVVDDI